LGAELARGSHLLQPAHLAWFPGLVLTFDHQPHALQHTELVFGIVERVVVGVVGPDDFSVFVFLNDRSGTALP
jgi:hypothetical protein